MAKKRYFLLIGIVLFLAILLNLDLNKLGAIILAANPFLFALAVALALTTAVLKGVRWKFIIRAHGFEYGWLDSIKGFFIGFLISIITPGRVGDFARALYLKQKSKSLGGAISTVFIDRIIDLATLFSLGFIAVVYFAVFLKITVIPIEYLAIIFSAFLVLLFLFLRKSVTGFVLKPFFNFLVPEKYKGTMRASFDDFYHYVAKAVKHKGIMSIAVGITLFDWWLSITIAFVIALALNLPIPYLFMLVTVPIISLLDLLPVSVSGIGTRDAAVIFLFSFYAVAAEQAIAFSLLYLAAGYVFTALVGALFFITNPVKLNLRD